MAEGGETKGIRRGGLVRDEWKRRERKTVPDLHGFVEAVLIPGRPKKEKSHTSRRGRSAACWDGWGDGISSSGSAGSGAVGGKCRGKGDLSEKKVG